MLKLRGMIFCVHIHAYDLCYWQGKGYYLEQCKGRDGSKQEEGNADKESSLHFRSSFLRVKSVGLNNLKREGMKLHCSRCLSWTGQNYLGMCFWHQVLLGSGLGVLPAPWEVNESLSPRSGSDLW